MTTGFLSNVAALMRPPDRNQVRTGHVDQIIGK